METGALQKAVSGACILARTALDETKTPHAANVSAPTRDVAILAAALLMTASISFTAKDLQEAAKQPV